MLGSVSMWPEREEHRMRAWSRARDVLSALETVQTTVAKGEKIAAFDGLSRAFDQGRDGGNRPAERSRQAGQRPKRRGGQAQRAVGDGIGKTTGPPRPDDARRIAPVDPQACRVCEMGLTSRHDSWPVSTARQDRSPTLPKSQASNSSITTSRRPLLRNVGLYMHRPLRLIFQAAEASRLDERA